MLTITGPGLPAAGIEVWYLEAWCRSGSTDRAWEETVIPHRTELVEASPDGRRLRLRGVLPHPSGEGGGRVVVDHEITAGRDEVAFTVTARNTGDAYVDAQWAQPCVRVGEFTGRDQEGYIERSFIFVEDAPGGLRLLDALPRAEAARYRGGQVWPHPGVPREDVNPRPVSSVEPVLGIIGCVSGDGERLLATAWEPWQELFQGVIVCLHADFRTGGLPPGAERVARGRLWVLPNDPDRLLRRYRAVFGEVHGSAGDG